jgi:hypothetical protein
LRKQREWGVDESFLTAGKAASGIYASPTAVQTLKAWDLIWRTDVDDDLTQKGMPVHINTINVQVGVMF